MTAAVLDVSAADRPLANTSPATVPESRRGELTRGLFAQITAGTDPRERRRLLESVVETNMGVAQSIARRYFGRGERDDDLEQVAYLGLVKAAHGFDDARGKDFLTYAVPTISGELKRHFRDHLLLTPLVLQLTARERDIIALRFYHDWTQEQIAQRFGITWMQVSRLLSKMMRQLRERIT